MLVIEISLQVYYDARSKKHQIREGVCLLRGTCWVLQSN